jgi:GNAT superfamily N-acetyltransferase
MTQERSTLLEVEGALPDGRRLIFRPIRPDDKEMIRVGFERLSPESRYLRFFRYIDHLSQRDLRYLTEIDFHNHFAWVGILPDEPGSPGVGVGRWVRFPNEPDIAEGAVTVVDDYHGLGIGRTLLWLMAKSAIEHGVRAFRAWTLGENQPMLQLLKSFGARPGRWEGGVMEVLVPLPDTVDRLRETPAPLVLRATAAGHFHGEQHPERPAAPVLRPSSSSEP